MSEPFIGEIRIVAFNYAPKGWAFCNGQLLPINQNQALFSLLGTTFGGNGTTTFALPDMQGRAPIHAGQGAGLSNRVLGEKAGEEIHTLTVTELPAHGHGAQGNKSGANSTNPANNVWAVAANANAYSATADTSMSQTSSGNAGGGQGHENRQPFLTCSCIIALQGIFPSQN